MSESLYILQPTRRENYYWRAREVEADPVAATWKDITREVANRHGLTWSEIMGPSRHRQMAWARHEAWSLIWAQGRLSLPQIGRRFDRDHTTVLSGIRRHRKYVTALRSSLQEARAA